MGTSKSYSGPRGKTALLPSWATSGPAAPAGSAATGATIPVAAPTSPAQPAQTISPQISPQVVVVSQPVSGASQPSDSSNQWTSARRGLSRAVNSSGSRSSLSKAGSSYVKALGGGRRATKSSGAGVRSTAALGGFLASVASSGLTEALRASGLTHLVGQGKDVVFAGLCDLLAPSGGPLEENLARESITEALEELYDKMILEGTDASAPDTLSQQDIQQATETAISAYVYNRWLLELGVKIEEHAVTPERAVKLERDMKKYIQDAVQLDFADVNILELDWQSGAGLELTEKLFEEAYSVLEEEE